MTTFIMVTIVIIISILLIYLTYRSIQKNRVKLNAPENFVTEESPIEIIEAEIIGMQVALDKIRRDNILPDHHIGYLVSFRLTDGTKKTMRVDKEIYDRISISEVGEIVIQNSVVLDFVQKDAIEETLL